MGLFDGFDGKSERGSTAEMAVWLDLPVVLVVDASAVARSAAAIVHGFRSFDPRVKLAGVIFNRVGGEKHYRILADAVTDVPILGWLPGNASVEIPERHLGLFTAKEDVVVERIGAIGEFVSANIDIDRILDLAELTIITASRYRARASRHPSSARRGMSQQTRCTCLRQSFFLLLPCESVSTGGSWRGDY